MFIFNSQFFKTKEQIIREVLELSSDQREKWIQLLSFGFFIMLFALFFILVPDYYSKAYGFLEDFFKLKQYPGGSGIYLPFPEQNHIVVYETVMRFCMIFGLFQFLVLGLRFYMRSAMSKVAETVSNIAIWLGAAYMFNLLQLGVTEWFPFLGGLVAIFGFSIVVRSLIVFFAAIYKK